MTINITEPDGGTAHESGQTIQCKICGEPYKFYMHMAGDQSACPRCRRKAEANR